MFPMSFLSGDSDGFLSFYQHASHVHIIDADTFEQHDVIRIPHNTRAMASHALASVQYANDSEAVRAYRNQIHERMYMAGLVRPPPGVSSTGGHLRTSAITGRSTSRAHLRVPRMILPSHPLSASPASELLPTIIAEPPFLPMSESRVPLAPLRLLLRTPGPNVMIYF